MLAGNTCGSFTRRSFAALEILAHMALKTRDGM